MFSPDARTALRDQLVERARGDAGVSAAALVGSAALDREDPWSDIDLALQLLPGVDPWPASDPWTAYLYEFHAAVHHLDVWSGPTLFRVFLLANTLQVDLSFWPSKDFAATGSAFRLIFGAANPPTSTPEPSVDGVVGTAWLYALHARSAVARGRAWQAQQMVNGLRDHVISLACRRHQVPSYQGRGVDQLPNGLLAELEPTLIRSLEPAELARAFGAVTRILVDETNLVDPDLGRRLAGPLGELVASVGDDRRADGTRTVRHAIDVEGAR